MTAPQTAVPAFHYWTINDYVCLQPANEAAQALLGSTKEAVGQPDEPIISDLLDSIEAAGGGVVDDTFGSDELMPVAELREHFMQSLALQEAA